MSLSGKPIRIEQHEVTPAGFYPAVDVSVLQESWRVNASFKGALLQQQLTHSVFLTHRALLKAKDAWQAEGYATLDAVPDETINGKGALVNLYERAVYSLAKALLFPDYVAMIRREEAENLNEDGPMAEEHYRTEHMEAVKLLLQASPIDDCEKPELTRWGIALI